MKNSRPLKKEEKDLVLAMLNNKPGTEYLRTSLDNALVIEMNDGGMGSLKFLATTEAPRRFARAVAEATATDEDGVVLSIELNIDNFGNLYELDIWKVDNSPLRQFPKITS